MMEGLGRAFNVAPTADGVWISLVDSSAVAFVGVGADTYTVQSASDAAGTGAADLAVVDHYAANANANGSTAWTEEEQAAAAAVTIAAGVAVIPVLASQLPAGHTHVRCSSTATGLVTAITHDLNVQRAPANLPAVSA
ncbi:hypothetical protein [Prauserella muralis]|uniref:Uncharacterized protein n=1 Tax=Prauserella muralis TaxID=588067 RepID=A0A2V4BCT8_9PSEU|nr:hypothetical protein [Prauserella muralis]PXY27429.1 hypothetical protein BAY60_13420 [Prauserella muralis]TWE22871.1 hypothetical protein FHX69_4127 [Prauserella muralis]